MLRREGRRQLVGGVAVLGWAVLAAALVSTLAWGGIWKAPILARVLWFSPAIVALVIGVVMVAGGVRKMLRSRRIAQQA